MEEFGAARVESSGSFLEAAARQVAMVVAAGRAAAHSARFDSAS